MIVGFQNGERRFDGDTDPQFKIGGGGGGGGLVIASVGGAVVVAAVGGAVGGSVGGLSIPSIAMHPAS